MKKWISIIVPVYNVEDYLDRCINSLLHQTINEELIEIILVDDGSTDTSGKKADYYASEFDNVKVIHKENGGLASARNEGMKYAVGEYIAFVDSDDWIDQNAYEKIYQLIYRKHIDILNYGYRKILQGNVLIEEYSEFEKGYYDKNQISKLILPNSIAREKSFNQVKLPVQLSACMCVYNRNFLESNNIYFESERIVLSEDWLFNIKCLCRANSIEIMHDVFYNYDTRYNSLSMSYKPDSYERRKVLFDRYKEELILTRQNNSVIEHRMENFWLEAIYGCYIIELNSPSWNKSKVEQICNDKEFRKYIAKLNLKNSTIKGVVFKFIITFRIHCLMRWAYSLKRRFMKNEY